MVYGVVVSVLWRGNSKGHLAFGRDSQRQVGGGGCWSEGVREEATTEHTDSDTHTQRERNTRRTHPSESVRGCEGAFAKGNVQRSG